MSASSAALADARALRTSFGASHLAKSLVWSFVDLLLAYFLYSVLHVPAERIARLLFVFLAFGALCDALVGATMTWLQARPRTVLWLHMAGAIGTGLALFVKFQLTLEAPWLILAAGLLFRFAFALYDVPHTALTSLLPSDAQDARAYVRLRTTLSAVARLMITGANLGLSQLPAEIFHAGGAIAVMGMSLLVVGSSAALLHAAPPDLPRRDPRTGITRLRPPPGLLRVLLAFLASTTLFATLSRLLIFTPSPPGLERWGGWLLMTFALGSVAGPILASRLQDRLGWRGSCLAASLSAILAGNLFLAARGGWTPSLQVVAAAVYGTGLGAVGACLWQAASDVVRAHAADAGERSDGLMFGLVIFTIQVSIALGSLILGAALDDHVRGGWGSAVLVMGVNTVGGILTLVLLAARPATPP